VKITRNKTTARHYYFLIPIMTFIPQFELRNFPLEISLLSLILLCVWGPPIHVNVTEILFSPSHVFFTAASRLTASTTNTRIRSNEISSASDSDLDISNTKFSISCLLKEMHGKNLTVCFCKQQFTLSVINKHQSQLSKQASKSFFPNCRTLFLCCGRW
jgi:hypothetical protein